MSPVPITLLSCSIQSGIQSGTVIHNKSGNPASLSLNASWNLEIYRTRKPVHMSAADALQREIERLIEVCTQLDSLANEHPHLGETLLGIAGGLRNSATLLELLVATKLSN